MKHELKISPEFYDAILNGHKTFEVRKKARGFAVGDTVVLSEWIKAGYTGREITTCIDYILEGFPGIEDDYCVFSFTIKSTLNL